MERICSWNSCVKWPLSENTRGPGGARGRDTPTQPSPALGGEGWLSPLLTPVSRDSQQQAQQLSRSRPHSCGWAGVGTGRHWDTAPHCPSPTLSPLEAARVSLGWEVVAVQLSSGSSESGVAQPQRGLPLSREIKGRTPGLSARLSTSPTWPAKGRGPKGQYWVTF